MTWPIRGVIEGFYGRPWSWPERIEIMRWCHERGMTHYLYAPKNDPLHRDRWREPYGADALEGFTQLVDADTMRVGFGISPGLSIDYDDADDRGALLTKVEQLLAVGVDLVCLALDDIPPRAGLGGAHAQLTRWLHDEIGARASLVLVPTEYTGTISTPYLDALAEGVPREVPIGWTGPTVVCDHISAADATARAASLGGRPPLIWDNYPVNDAIMSDRLFLGPLRGRAPELAELCSGYVANPMVQPFASRVPLASIAAFLRGDDPEAVWREEADAMDMRAFAEACDGARPRALIEELGRAARRERDACLRNIDEWLTAVERFEPTAEVADEIAAWREQCTHEIGVWRCALRTLRFAERNDGPRAMAEAMGLLYLWPSVRRAAVSVMGPRCSFRPVFGQWPDGSWRYDASSLDEDRNATDALARFALAEVAAWSP